MRINTSSLALLASLAILASAIPDQGNGHHGHPSCRIPKPPPYSTQCYTQMASTRVKHKSERSWSTYYTPCTITATCTVTTTSTATSTPIVTDTSTVTTDTTTTVAAPATFTPVQTSLPGSTYSGSGGPDPVSKRNLGTSLNPRSSKHLLVLGKKHEQGVQCYKWQHKRCTTTTSTITSTVVVTGTAKATTVTTTTTSFSSTSTVYAACATNDLADAYLGTPFIEVEGGFSAVFSTTVDTAYDCCVAAITMPDTSVFAFEPAGDPGSLNCFIGQTDGTCPAPVTNPSTAITSADGDLVIGNAYCGVINNAIAEVFPSSSLVARAASPT